VWEEMRCARLCLYRPEAGDGRRTRGIAITSCVEIGDGRAARESSPLTCRRLPKRRSGANCWHTSEDASSQGRWQEGPTKRSPDVSGHFTRPRNVRRDISDAYIGSDLRHYE
jgi:hypothetical protein